MKEFVLKKSSWHYKIANFGGRYAYYCDDICEYTRKFFTGLLSIIFLTAVIGTVGGLYLYGFGNVIGWLFLDYKLEPPVAMFFGINLALLAIVAYEAVKKVLSNRKPVHKEPGFVSLAYDKFKNKTCSRIRFED